MNPCRVCGLPTEYRAAINDALRNGVPLDEIAEECGIGRSSLHRHHRRHLKLQAVEPGSVELEADDPSTPRVAPFVPKPRRDISAPQASFEIPMRQQLLERIELLWSEGLLGLSDSKAKIDLTRTDGSKFELNGDLRARRSFITELREIVRLQGEASGEIVRGQNVEQNFAVQIVMPTLPSTNVPIEEPTVIDIAPTYRGSG